MVRREELLVNTLLRVGSIALFSLSLSYAILINDKISGGVSVSIILRCNVEGNFERNICNI